MLLNFLKSMILQDYYYTLPYTKRLSSFLCVFWLCMYASTNSKFLNVNGDLAFLFSVMLSSCTLTFMSFGPLSFTFALSLIRRFICIKIQFSNSECKNAIQNAERQPLNPEMSFHEVRIQSMNAESISGIQNCS